VRVLALDISTSAGWALFEDNQLAQYGHIGLEKTVREYGEYPWNYVHATRDMAMRLAALVSLQSPDVVVIEETNLGRNRYSQKVLEFLHANFLALLALQRSEQPGSVIYVSSSAWRKAIKLEMSSEDKKSNQLLSRAKSKAKKSGAKLDKAALGISGKVTKKHLAVRWANENYDLQLKQKDNDVADAICLGAAFIEGVTPCDGVVG
jgi:hypothetical protein